MFIKPARDHRKLCGSAKNSATARPPSADTVNVHQVRIRLRGVILCGMHGLEKLFRSCHSCAPAAARCRLAHMANAEREDEAVERNAAAVRQWPRTGSCAEVSPQPSRSFNFFSERSLRASSVKMSCGALNQAIVVKLLDHLVAHALDVEGIARHEMLQPFDTLRRADQAAGTAAHRIKFLPVFSLTSRTAWLPHAGQGRETRTSRIRRALVRHVAQHLRDHVAGPLHDHRVADAASLRAISSSLCSVAFGPPPRPP
jgi:hypothetical protein